MTSRLRMLALGPQDVFPPVDGGKEGIYGALSALARRADVTYAFPATPATSLAGYERIGVKPAPLDVAPQESAATILGATLRLKPYKFEKYGSARMLAALDRALGAGGFDAIVCHHAHMFRLAGKLQRLRGWTLPTIVREHNLEYGIVESFRDSMRGGRRVAADLFATLTRREEHAIWRQADAVAFLSDSDLEVAQRSGVAGRFILAREGVPLPPRRPIARASANAPLLVLLNPRAAQSVANLHDFVDAFWKPLRARGRLADDVLHVTGVTTEQLATLVATDARELAQLGISGLGFLPSLEETLQGALALVSPTFIGGGIRKKVLEAMAHQLPVIATEMDMRTCSYFERGVNILPMDTPDMFADIVGRLRADEAHWRDISARARDTVEEFANWDRYGGVMFDIASELVRARAT